MPLRLSSSWPEPDLLHTLRRVLDEADDALVCVSAVSADGVRLIEPQLARLGDRARFVVAGGGEPCAVADLVRHGAGVRTLELPGRSLHAKLYLTRRGERAAAIVGSADLTAGGLGGDIEAAFHVEGGRRNSALAAAWELGERLWSQAGGQG